MRRGVVLLAALLLVCTLMAGAVSAEDNSWDTLYANLTTGDNYSLTGPLTAGNTSLTIGEGKTVTLNLGANNLSNTTANGGSLITLNGGNLTITGTNGVIFSENTTIVTVKKGKLIVSSGVTLNTSKIHGIGINGNEGDPNASEYSVVDVQSGATIDGGVTGITISTTIQEARGVYGVNLTVNGVVKTTVAPELLSSNGGTIGINVNGFVNNVKNASVNLAGNVPQITIGQSAQITAVRGTSSGENAINSNDGPAVYAPGYANWIINGGNFTGDEAFSIKSGNFTINDGSFAGNGVYRTPATSWNGGSEATGGAVSITTNGAYAQNVNITINGGTFTSANQSAFYEGYGSAYPETALKKVAISGGTFTTNNSTLSAVTIQNSGNSTISGGISIKDSPSGNNLLYRGVNLTSSGNTYNAKWGGDNTGYTLDLSTAGTYKLMDAFSTTGTGIKITADGVTLDGNGKQITAKSPTEQSNSYSTAVSVTGKNATLKNLNLVADTTFKEPNGGTKGQYLTAIYVSPTNGDSNSAFTLLDSTLNMSKAESGNQTMVVRVAGTHKTVTITNNSIHGAKSNNAETIQDSGNLGTSFGIAVEGASISDKLTIDKNTSYPGIAGNSGSIGMRTFTLGQGPTNDIVIDKNTIDFQYATGGQYFSGIHMDQHETTGVILNYTITNNTILNLKAGEENRAEESNKNSGIYLRNADKTGVSISLKMHDNSISGTLTNNTKNVTVFYAKNVTFGESTIYNNTFNITGTNVLNYVHLTNVKEENKIKWNSTGSDKQHAGNWWGTWSKDRKDTKGYLMLTEKAAGLPVADLRPLVTEGTPASTITITGDLSIENKTTNTGTLTAKFGGETPAEGATWTVSPDDVITLSGTGSSVTYKPKKVGNATVTVKAMRDSAEVTASVVIAVYEVVKPDLPVSKVETDEDGKTTISNNTAVEIKQESGKDVATIKDDAGVTLKLTFDESGATTSEGQISGNVTEAVVTYPANTVVSSPKTSIAAEYKLAINLGKNVTNYLPEIDPSYNTTVEKTLTDEFADAGKYTFVSMITAKGENVTKINKNITKDGIAVTFTVPLDWANQITKNTLGKIKVFHVKDDGTIEGPLGGTGGTEGDNYIFTVKGSSFSSYVLAAYTYTATPASSGGSGNMDGALRVLFNDGSATLSVVTGLSYGDKLTAPANPVKDGYTFAGWYKDEACTQAWSFSDGIPGDMTLYAKWTGGSSSSQSSSQQSGTTTQPTAKATSAPASTQSQSGTSATSAPVSTTAASGVSPTMTQAPAPVLGGLFGLLAAGV
ncbi:MAG: InlB B-repeat-containing protein, partial [Methanocorpusculum sp.]|nr:InlB B-repeat-containing protein [Methanocorpusculum sp.]